MSNRLEVLENKPGVLRVNVVNAFKLIDGDITVTVQWSDAEGEGTGYWWARLDDAKGRARTVRYTPNADGPTREEALAHLAIAAYVGLIEDAPTPTLLANASAGQLPTDEPRKYDQVPNGCYAACLAGLAGIPHGDLSRFVPDESAPFEEAWPAYHAAVINRLLGEGFAVAKITTANTPPTGFAVASGPAERGLMHSVIVKDGELWHDPHPSRVGLRPLAPLVEYEVLVPVRPAALASTRHTQGEG